MEETRTLQKTVKPFPSNIIAAVICCVLAIDPIRRTWHYLVEYGISFWLRPSFTIKKWNMSYMDQWENSLLAVGYVLMVVLLLLLRKEKRFLSIPSAVLCAGRMFACHNHSHDGLGAGKWPIERNEYTYWLVATVLLFFLILCSKQRWAKWMWHLPLIIAAVAFIGGWWGSVVFVAKWGLGVVTIDFYLHLLLDLLRVIGYLFAGMWVVFPYGRPKNEPRTTETVAEGEKKVKFCSHCGKEIMDEAVVCPHCGCAVALDRKELDIPDTGLNIISLLMPIVGLILYIVYHEKSPDKAASIGKFAWIGVGIGIGSYLLLLLMLA